MRLPRSVHRALTRAFARSKAHVPEQAWPVLLTLRSVTGKGPLVGEPSFGRVVALAAHPDDESLGCAGTLALLRQRGTAVTMVFATDGTATRGADLDADEIGRRRRAEAVAACALLGIDDVRFAGLPDGGLPARVDDLTDYLRPLLDTSRPDAVFLPWFLDGHPDHAAVGASLAGLDLAPALELWGYETWTPLPANRMVDVTSVVATKEAAISAHATAALAFDLHAALGLNRWRSIHGLMGRGYAEAFLALPAPAWLELRARALAVPAP